MIYIESFLISTLIFIGIYCTVCDFRKGKIPNFAVIIGAVGAVIGEIVLFVFLGPDQLPVFLWHIVLSSVIAILMYLLKIWAGGDVKLFVDKEYFDAHESGELRVSDELYILRVLGFITISANSAIYNLREYQNDRNAQIVEQFKKLATNWRDVYRGGKLLLLSTCNENARKYRDVLLLEVLK